MLVHLNGKLITRDQARIDPFDRGFIFGEGVYEGLRSIAWDRSQTIKDLAGASGIHAADIIKRLFLRGKMATVSSVIDTSTAESVLAELGWSPGDSISKARTQTRIIGLSQHIRRMQRGLEAAAIHHDISNLGNLSTELVQANNLRDAFVYWQITGGTPGEGDPVRSRARGKNTKPTIFGYCTPQPSLESQTIPSTKKAITQPDLRWHLGWLKCISLMGNVLAAKNADERGCDESIFIRGGDERGNGGLITEGLATNVFLALPRPGGKIELATPALDSAPLLAGITRDILLKLEPSLVSRPVRAEELREASEVMLLGTTTMVTSITELNGKPIGDGKPGPQARRLLDLLVTALKAGRDME